MLAAEYLLRWDSHAPTMDGQLGTAPRGLALVSTSHFAVKRRHDLGLRLGYLDRFSSKRR